MGNIKSFTPCIIRNLVKEVISEVVAGEIQKADTGQSKEKEKTDKTVTSPDENFVAVSVPFCH